MVNIVIVDSVRVRREAQCKYFSSATIMEYWNEPGKTFISPHPEEEVHIAFVHYGDRKLDAAQYFTAKANLVIYYGGNGELDSRWTTRPNPKDCDERILRAIPTDKEALTPNEAKELLEYLSKIKKGEHPEEKPEFLWPPKTRPIITAISILCQGHEINDVNMTLIGADTMQRVFGADYLTALPDLIRKELGDADSSDKVLKLLLNPTIEQVSAAQASLQKKLAVV